MSDKPTTYAEYLALLPPDQAAIVDQVRAAILRGIPDAEEKISYSMPAVVLPGRPNLHYAAWKDHIGIYPVWNLSDELEAEVADYRSTTNSLKFKYKDGIPYELIERIAAESSSG